MNETIPSVTPNVFSSKLGNSIMIIYYAVKQIILPIALVGITFGIIILLIGSICHSKKIKEMGAIDMALSCGGVLLFYGIPLILGFIKTIGSALAI